MSDTFIVLMMRTLMVSRHTQSSLLPTYMPRLPKSYRNLAFACTKDGGSFCIITTVLLLRPTPVCTY